MSATNSASITLIQTSKAQQRCVKEDLDYLFIYYLFGLFIIYLGYVPCEARNVLLTVSRLNFPFCANCSFKWKFKEKFYVKDGHFFLCVFACFLFLFFFN